MTDNNADLPWVEGTEVPVVPTKTLVLDKDGIPVEVTEEVAYVQDEGPVATELQQ